MLIALSNNLLCNFLWLQAFQDDTPAAPPPKREFRGLAPPALPQSDAPNVAAEKPKKAEVVESTSGGLDPRSVALPGAWRGAWRWGAWHGGQGLGSGN